MNKKEIEIDFTKSKNKVVLFIGSNGSGKTSILSSLHPYAYLGSLDVRNSAGIIREGHDGYKEIHYQKDNDIYVIKHNYLFSKKNQVLKSFILKNGVELNPNGNVGSFIETVAEELSLKQDFLRLVRLGSNVNNLIDMKATERKTFTSNLLSDMNIYSDLFKKISDDSRVIRGLLKSVSDKINRLNISDLDIIQSEIDKLNTDLDQYTKQKDTYQRELGSLEGTLSATIPDGIDWLTARIQDNKLNLRALSTKLRSLQEYFDTTILVMSSDISFDIEHIEKLIRDHESAKQTCESIISFYKEQLSKSYDVKDSILNKIKLCKTDDEYYKLLDLKVELMNKIESGKDKFSNYSNPYTKDELLTLLKVLMTLTDITKDIYGFDIRSVKKVVSLIREGINIDIYIDDELSKINAELLAISSKLHMDMSNTSPLIVFRPPDCNVSECPYTYLYEALFTNTNNPKTNIPSLNTQKEILEDMANIKKNIDYIFMILRSNSHLIEKGTIEYFKISNILDCIEKGDDIFNEDVITDMITEAEEYNEYISAKTELSSVLAELKSISNNKNDIEILRGDLERVETEITDILKAITDKETEINNIETEISKLSDTAVSLHEYRELTQTYKDISNRIFEIEKEIKSDEKLLNTVSDIQIKIKNVNQLINTVNWNIEKVNSELFTKKVAMQDFIKLSEEKDTLNSKFDDIETIREALSPTKGIPLLYIQLYLKNTTLYVNNLLQSVYGDEFAIDDFEITPTEFNIPYIKNGVRINDVAYASQGEKSFLSLALSFALINQSIKDYNILLLDEIDSTLDTKNRAMFLNILEKQMEIIDADQIFLITHNNMFDSYPVDVVLTSDYHMGNYNNANVIYQNN